jgi:very-short-patch-repair endonuclease
MGVPGTPKVDGTEVGDSRLPLNEVELSDWQELPRQPVTESADPKVRHVLAAAQAGTPIHIKYMGGSTPGKKRHITPIHLFTVEGYSGVYVEALCHLREEERVFRLDKINLLDKAHATLGRQPVGHDMMRDGLNDKWKRLLQYYLDCILAENVGEADFYDSDENKTFVQVGSCEEWISSAKQTIKVAISPEWKFSKNRKWRKQVTYFYGYPVFIDHIHKSRRGWTGNIVRPVLLWPVSTDVQSDKITLHRQFEEPRVNPSFLKSRKISLPPDMRKAMLEDILRWDVKASSKENLLRVLSALREFVGGFETIEDVDLYNLSTVTPLIDIDKSGIVNRAMVFATTQSKYTAGLENELSNLMAKRLTGNPESAIEVALKRECRVTSAFPDSLKVEVTDLNDEQRKAVQSSLKNKLTVVTGPPGTGKSQVVLSVIANALIGNESVLFASKNHKAVEVVIERLDALQSTPVVLKYGLYRNESSYAQMLMASVEQAAAVNLGMVKLDARDIELQLSQLHEKQEQLWDTLDKVVTTRNKIDALDRIISELKVSLKEKGMGKFSNAILPPDCSETAERIKTCVNKVINNLERKGWLLSQIRQTQDKLSNLTNISEEDFAEGNFDKIESSILPSAFHKSVDKIDHLYKKLQGRRNWFASIVLALLGLSLKRRLSRKIKALTGELSPELWTRLSDFQHNERNVQKQAEAILLFWDFSNACREVLPLVRLEIELAERAADMQKLGNISLSTTNLVELSEKLLSIWEVSTKHHELSQLLSVSRSYASLTTIRRGIQDARSFIKKRSTKLLDLKTKTRLAELPAQVKQGVADYVNVVKRVEEDVVGGKVADNLRKERHRLFKNIKRAFPALAVTNLSVRHVAPLEEGVIDLVVIDEASQCDIASALPLLYRAKRALILGDPNQLIHVTPINRFDDQKLQEKHELKSAEDARFLYSTNSLFNLGQSVVGSGAFFLHLKDCYRSKKEIVEFSNKKWYGGILNNWTDYRKLKGNITGRSVTWHDVSGEVIRPSSGSAYNLQEAKAVVNLIRELLENSDLDFTLGIVTPFANHAYKIDDMVRRNFKSSTLDKIDFISHTAHKFQGDERDVMVFSPVVSKNMSSGGEGFLAKTQNLFNVAITRARTELHIVGDRNACLKCRVGYLRDFVKYVDALTFRDEEHGKGKFESPWEEYLYNRLKETGIKTIPQYPVNQFRLDLAIPDNDPPIDIEVDGEYWHREMDGSRCREDIKRDIKMTKLGWAVVRFWVYELQYDLAACIERVRKTLSKKPV